MISDAEKALRFDLDQASMERREREATELVDLRAQIQWLGSNLEIICRERDQLLEALRILVPILETNNVDNGIGYELLIAQEALAKCSGLP